MKTRPNAVAVATGIAWRERNSVISELVRSAAGGAADVRAAAGCYNSPSHNGAGGRFEREDFGSGGDAHRRRGWRTGSPRGAAKPGDSVYMQTSFPITAEQSHRDSRGPRTFAEN